MRTRISIVLPERTVRMVDRVAGKRGRSRFIDQAVRDYASSRARRNLRELLKEGAIRNKAIDLEIAEEWFPLEEEAWRVGQGSASSARRDLTRAIRPWGGSGDPQDAAGVDSAE